MTTATGMRPKNTYSTNSCELLNRHELSRSQERALQRFIEQNAHLLKRLRNAQLDVESREFHHSPSKYSSLQDSVSRPQVPSSVLRHNHSPTFVQRSRSVGFLDSSSAVVGDRSERRLHNTIGPPKKKEVKWSDVEQVPKLSEQRARSLSPSRDRSFTPPQTSLITRQPQQHQYQQHLPELSKRMIHYGSTGNINDRWFTNEQHHQAVRDRTASPAYSSLDRNRDDYNRYETARHSHTKNIQRVRRDEELDRSRFSGYGDRPGSGVEFAPSKWHGGEIITDRRLLPKSLKPRRIYYSPIGDGVVAADGLEMKRQPKDMSPRISVTQTRIIEKDADPGRDGYNLYEKHVTHSGAGSEYDSEYGGGGTSGRNSRNGGAFSLNSFGGIGGGAGALQYSPGSGSGGGGLAGPGPLPGPPRGEYHQSAATTPKHFHQYSHHPPPPPTSHHQLRDYGNEPLGDIYPLSGSGSSAPKYMPVGSGIMAGAGGGRVYSSNTPTPTFGGANSPSTGELFGSSAPTSNYTTLASRGVVGSTNPCGTFHSAHSENYTSEYKARSRSHDPATDAFDGLGGGHYYGGPGVDGRSSAASGYSYSLRTDSPRRYDTITTDYLITNPRELIHQYATTTPVAVLDVNSADNQSATDLMNTSRGGVRATTYTTNSNSAAATTTEEKYAPYPPYKGSETTVHPNNFVRQLRDENLTISQREANRHMEPLNLKGPTYEQKLCEIRSRTTKGGTNVGDEIDYLTEKMMYGLQTGHPTPPQL